ncbi:hypothetical protein P7K49_022514 [Saguinus oedipus]|uniref:Uncharacterized protein n=1 Tax=Saguinus oedipus TaxID=9490 RepID=A0ABQ9UWF5_SAGOE|nr:hypothetical protein P7K49_022514 [Saguinus oedipus]
MGRAPSPGDCPFPAPWTRPAPLGFSILSSARDRVSSCLHRRAGPGPLQPSSAREARPPHADPPPPPGPPRLAPPSAAPGFLLPFPTRPGCVALPAQPAELQPLCPAALGESAMGTARWLALGSLLALAGLLEGRLVGEEEAGFGECDKFFYAGTPPAGLATDSHVKICQRAEGAERFATLYSTRDRIPVYSAFRAPRPAPGGAEQRWLVEPQVSEAVPEPGCARWGPCRWTCPRGALQPPPGAEPGTAIPMPSVPWAKKPGFQTHPVAPPKFSRPRPLWRLQ